MEENPERAFVRLVSEVVTYYSEDGFTLGPGPPRGKPLSLDRQVHVILPEDSFYNLGPDIRAGIDRLRFLQLKIIQEGATSFLVERALTVTVQVLGEVARLSSKRLLWDDKNSREPEIPLYRQRRPPFRLSESGLLEIDRTVTADLISDDIQTKVEEINWKQILLSRAEAKPKKPSLEATNTPKDKGRSREHQFETGEFYKKIKQSIRERERLIKKETKTDPEYKFVGTWLTKNQVQTPLLESWRKEFHSPSLEFSHIVDKARKYPTLLKRLKAHITKAKK